MILNISSIDTYMFVYTFAGLLFIETKKNGYLTLKSVRFIIQSVQHRFFFATYIFCI